MCHTNLRTIKQACHDYGTPIEEAKCEGPSTVITFLGMELDTVALEICLPADKLKEKTFSRSGVVERQAKSMTCCH